ncbi:LegC family aminotransferase [Macrococcus armenti]|uniref:LegC family aminotransferase n=1 Tax=Macrococcus armenti TaxID=2875764 RepID=A0ABY3ZWE0_9STAP|nr:LegC family aminotransferase [Macrococcus armenti]UOB21230.1 LegC family aminotransferase [Macrococcus armenti]
MIPLSVPNIKGNEIKYVTEALESEWVSSAGSYIVEFENKIADYLKVNSAVACQSGTAGLHLSMRVAGITQDDEVFGPTLTFIAAINPIKYLYAHPVFIDCDENLCINPDSIEKFIEINCTFTEEKKLINKKTNRQIKAIIAVHVFGNMCDMERLMEISKKYNLKLIEDATEALGSYYTDGPLKGKYAGTIGDYGVYSFNGNKIITTGGGGMIVAKSEKDLAKIKSLSTQAKSDEVFFDHDDIGYNYRMTNIQAAIGVAQLEQLENFIETKEKNYNLYKKHLEESNYSLMDFRKDIRPNYWFYALNISESGFNTRTIINELSKSSIQARPIWKLIHTLNPYKDELSFKINLASKFVEEIINIPCSSNLTEENVLRVCEILKGL